MAKVAGWTLQVSGVHLHVVAHRGAGQSCLSPQGCRRLCGMLIRSAIYTETSMFPGLVLKVSGLVAVHAGPHQRTSW